jgi:tripartite-type tricarboxylate transporter receptor subunit TctC
MKNIMQRLSRVAATLLQVSAVLLCGAAHAQNYPNRPVKIIVPSSPGGSIDATARIVGEKLSDIWGQPVVIENRAGASMRIGAEAASRSAPDGYTLLVAHDGTMAINPAIYPELRYDPVKSFEPVGILASDPYVILVNADLPIHTVADLLAFAKKSPEKLNHAGGGASTVLALELFKALSKTEINNVMYRGGGPSVAAVMSDESQFTFVDIGSGSSGMASKRIRPIAISSTTRHPKFPNLPTIDEAGVKGYENTTWMGMFAPAGTPKPVVAAIEKAVQVALKDPSVRGRLDKIGMDPRSGSAAEMRDVLAADMVKWKKLVTEHNIKIGE